MAEETKKAVPEKFKKLVEEIEKMSVLELSELVKVLEDRFGVSAAMMAAPVAVAASGADGGASAGEVTKKVELTSAGDQKVQVIKVIREITGLGLKEAKDLVDAAPKVIKEGLKQEEAEAMVKQLEAAGAKVAIK
jgi:large subunit ribosomal protein L7/L12